MAPQFFLHCLQKWSVLVTSPLLRFFFFKSVDYRECSFMEFGPFDRTLALHSVERTTDLKFMAKLLCSSCGWSLSMHGWMDGWLVRKVEFFPPHRGYIKWTKIGVESYLEQKGKNIITKAIFSEGCSIFFCEEKASRFESKMVTLHGIFL